MNKIEKFMTAFLLANIALVGALHYFPPVKPAVSAAKSEAVNVPANKPVPASAFFTPAAFSPDTFSGSLDQFRRWAERHPDAAWDCALEEPAGDRRVEMLEALCYQVARDGDPARAVALADNLHLTGHGTLANLEQQWAQSDLPAARVWAVAKPAGNEKNELLERVAYVWASSDPEDAARLVLGYISPGNAQTEAVISVVHQWALRDMDGARAWVLRFPEGDIRERAINELTGIRQYSQADGSRGSSQGGGTQ